MQNRCREKITSTISTKLSVSTLYKLLLSTSTILPLLPALFSCTMEEYTAETRIALTQAEVKGCLDVFTFNDDKMESLDSYQRWEHFCERDIGVRTQNGKKLVFICANGQRERQDWAAVNSLSSMKDIQVDLRKEKRESPCMTGHIEIKTGKPEGYEVSLRRIASEIKLNSLRCDFRGKAYEGAELDDVKVYLTNVNTRCGITSDGETLPTEIINAGRADTDDLEMFGQPDMIYQEVKGRIGNQVRTLDIGLLCYPNASRSESPGTPFTRLVIEGSLDGETYWWPIEINRSDDTEEPGIYRNRQYIFDICLTRKGSSDPDMVLETDAADIDMKVRSWTEKEGYQVVY